MQVLRCLFCLLVTISAAEAQSLFGTILGTVTDSSGAVVAGATITIRNAATGASRVLSTDAAGNYQAPALPVGVYDVTCELPGFKRAVFRAVTLEVDQRARVDISLEIGDVQQMLEVSGSAPLIETDTASQGTVIDNRRIVQLPLNGRNFQQLAALGPGVAAPVPGSGERLSVSGVQVLSNSFMLDGATNTNPNGNVTYINPSIDLIQEFKIQRNFFNAEFGRGAAQINVVTKSGTNQLHATVFEFLRNDKLQARNFFDREQKPMLRRNQFGGTVSGPVLVPGVYDGHNKSFFLANFEGLRQRNPSTQLSSVPTQAELNGDLSSQASVIDPTNAQPFPNKQIPASRIDPASRNYRQFMPHTDLPRGAFGTGLNFITATSALDDFDQMTLKLDHHFSSASQGFARYTLNDSTTITPGVLPIYNSADRMRQQHAVAGHNWVLRPNVINEFRANYSRWSRLIHAEVATTFGRNFAQTVGLKNLLSVSEPAANGVPVVMIQGLTQLGGGTLLTQRANIYSFVNNLSWVSGKHTYKFGADIRRILMDIRNMGSTGGLFTFTGVFSRSPLGDFLLGIPQRAQGTAPPGMDGVNLSTVWQAFAQDEWKAGKHLTLSIGVRYEYQTPYINDRDRISIFDPDFPGGRLIYPGVAEYFVPRIGFVPTQRPLASRGLHAPDRNNIAPRFGFAWRPRGDNRSAVRGSYGIFFQAPNDNNTLVSTQNPPHILRHDLINDVTRPSFVWSQLFPDRAEAINVTSVFSINGRLPFGYLQQWGLNVQREAARNLAVEVGYTGSKGTKLDQRRLLNQAVPSANPAQPTPIASRVPYPAFNPVLIFFDKTAASNYHALVGRVERRFSRGISFLAAYTWSKSIDDASFSGLLGGAGSQPAFPQDSRNLRADRGLSYHDVPHRVVVSSIWEVPFGPGKPFLNGRNLASRILGGWQITGIYQYQTGNPWSVLMTGDWANVGGQGNNHRANVVGNPYPDGFVRGGPERVAFDRSAFSAPIRGTFGNSGRNILRDAALNNLDVGIFKDTQVFERLNLQFRAEFFNIANHTQFQRFDNLFNSATFGTWNQARDPRIVQLGLKLLF